MRQDRSSVLPHFDLSEEIAIMKKQFWLLLFSWDIRLYARGKMR
jgi:hypothetical protein